jgi:hypothetical protein
MNSFSNDCSFDVKPTMHGNALINALTSMTHLRVTFRPMQRLIRHMVSMNTEDTLPIARPNLGTWNAIYFLKCLKLRVDISSSSILMTQDLINSGINSDEAALTHSVTDDVSQHTVLSALWPRMSQLIMSDVNDVKEAFLGLKLRKEEQCCGSELRTITH